MKKTKIKFHLFDFKFIPYEGNNKTSKSILIDCIQKINDVKTKQQSAIVIDRHENRDKLLPRNLFVSSAAFLPREKKYKCRIALIREGKIPKIVNKENYNITDLKSIDNKQAIAEITNFYIDVNNEIPVVCCEFNSNGPRISDIEFLFRHISSHKMLKISKSCKASLHMDTSVDEVLDSLSDVLKFEIKAKPNRLNYLTSEVEDSFIGNMNALADTIDPKSIRIDAFFREKGKQSGKKNNKAVAFVTRVLQAVKNDNKISEGIDDFTLEYETRDGNEAVFSLIKGKVEFVIDCTLNNTGNIDTKYMYKKVSIKFNSYLSEKNE